MLFWSALLVLLLNPTILALKVGRINDARLTGSSLSINGTCQQCICMMVSSARTISSLNCFTKNKTCELFLNYSSPMIYRLQRNERSIFYFQQLPTVTSEERLPTTRVTSSTLSSSTNQFSKSLPPAVQSTSTSRMASSSSNQNPTG